MQDIPYGYCQCGCGRATKPAAQNDPRYGHVKGQPVAYVRGHNRDRSVPAIIYRDGDDVLHRDTAWPWKIPLRRIDKTVGAWTLVTEADYVWAKHMRWSMTTSSYAISYGTAERRYLHRLVLGLAADDPRQGDHINHDTLDNRRANLRVVADQAANTQNTSSHRGASSSYRGVSWDKRAGRWEASCKVDGRKRFLGYYDDEAEAADAAVPSCAPAACDGLTGVRSRTAGLDNPRRSGNVLPMTTAEYRPAIAECDATAKLRAAVNREINRHDWAEAQYHTDGTATVAVLDFRGIISELVTVAA
jgi:hypothetical protein